MLLGITFHLSLPYTGVEFRGYFVTPERSLPLQTLLTAHYFRMPVFFLLSGFFSACILERRGIRGFLRTRCRRIGLVWIAALALEWPLIVLISVYNHFASKGGPAMHLTWQAVISRQIYAAWLQEPPLHLWFLEYLLLFSVLLALMQAYAGESLAPLDAVTAWVLRSKFRLVIAAVPTAVSLWRMPLAVMPYPGSFVPWANVCLGYGWFFAAGCLLYRQRHELAAHMKLTLLEKTAAPVLWLVLLVLLRRREALPLPVSAFFFDAMLVIATALFIWSTVVLLLSVFSRIQPKPWLPYLADACYWIYLAHYPLASLLPALLRNWSVPPLVKVIVSTVLIYAVLMIIYDRAIRYSWVGHALNGARVRLGRAAAA